MKSFLGITLFSVVLIQGQIPVKNGSATGQLRSPDGLPASGVRVAAVPVTAGADLAPIIGITQTDSAGRYRLENLPIGPYYVQAGVIDHVTYYPGVNDLGRAVNITISDGAVREGVDFIIGQFKVRGRVPLTAPTPSAIAMLSAGSVFIRETAVDAKDRSFEFFDIPPGKYFLLIPGASLPISVGTRDVDLRLPAVSGFKVRGLAQVSEEARATGRAKVVLTMVGAWDQIGAAIDDEGRFEFDEVPPGTYTIQVFPIFPGSPAKEILVTDQPILDVFLPYRRVPF